MSDLEHKFVEAAELFEKAQSELSKKIVGQTDLNNRLVVALVAGGHILLEGLPGLAKTTSIKGVAELSQLSFKRIQFTPDLLPADVTGTQIFDMSSSKFIVRRGPIFANLVLADEINRAPAKVQSALLEAMEEKQITIGDETFSLDRPFLVMATQNPIEQEGTYNLPEAQLDRFMFKVQLSYGSKHDEFEISRRVASGSINEALSPILSAEKILELRALSDQVLVSDKVRGYMVDIVFATRTPADYGLNELSPYIEVGASPRATINLEKAAKVYAAMQGRGYVIPQDIKDIGPDILRHRILLTYEAEAENLTTDKIIQSIFERVDVP